MTLAVLMVASLAGVTELQALSLGAHELAQCETVAIGDHVKKIDR